MTYPVKIEFKNWPSGSWEDWSEYLIKPPTINKRVESENQGEAGIIVFDSAAVSLRYESGNPVHDAFSIDLTNIQRYVFRIFFPKSDKTYVQMFEGMADFASVKWNDFINTITFNVVDKISALGILYAELARQSVSIKDRVQAQFPGNLVIDFIFSGTESEFWIASAANSELGTPYDSFSSVVVNAGEVISIPEKTTATGTDYEFKLHVVTESTLANHPTWPALTFNKVKILPYHANVSSYTYRFEDTAMDDIECYAKEIYGVDANNITAGVLQSLDGLKLILALYTQAWSDASLTLKPVDFEFAIPSGYAIQLVDSEPFGVSPLDALKKLADTIRCYVYIDKGGNLIIQNKGALGTSGTTRSIGTTKIIKGSGARSYFWDKLVDGVTVTIKSWLIDEFGTNLEGAATRTKQVPGTGANIKPKNLLVKEMLTSDPDDNTAALLEARAISEADAYLSFYGLRKNSYPDFGLNLDDNTINWEIVDNITLSSAAYFFSAIKFDGAERTVSLEAVEVAGHEYDLRQIIVPLGESAETITVLSGGSLSGTGVLTIGSLKKRTLTGAIDSNNKIFTLHEPPASNFYFLFQNGVYQHPGQRYTMEDNKIIFKKAPAEKDKLDFLA